MNVETSVDVIDVNSSELNIRPFHELSEGDIISIPMSPRNIVCVKSVVRRIIYSTRERTIRIKPAEAGGFEVCGD